MLFISAFTFMVYDVDEQKCNEQKSNEQVVNDLNEKYGLDPYTGFGLLYTGDGNEVMFLSDELLEIEDFIISQINYIAEVSKVVDYDEIMASIAEKRLAE
jgi:hypothetical protein